MKPLTSGAVLVALLATQAIPAVASPVESGQLIRVASGGWATRAEGKRSTYDQPYYGDYGYDAPYGYPGYAPPPYAYRPQPRYYDYEDDGGYDAY